MDSTFETWKKADANLYAALKAAALPLAEGVKHEVNKHTNLINAKLVIEILERIEGNDKKLREEQSVRL